MKLNKPMVVLDRVKQTQDDKKTGKLMLVVPHGLGLLLALLLKLHYRVELVRVWLELRHVKGDEAFDSW
eukprot:1365579-Amorphochlora_amoeboformis.AAC.2